MMWAATAYPSFDAERRELRASEKEPPVLADSLFSPLQHTNTYLHVIQPQEEKLGSAVVASTQLPTRLQKRRASDALVDLQNSKRAKSAVKNLLTQSCPHFSNSKDGKRLPSTSHCGFNLITSTTVRGLLAGEFGKKLRYLILDCRFPYEYEGGHIADAVNVPFLSSIQSFFQQPPPADERVLVVFHCEFSSERGPEVLRAFRNMDRNLNKDNWPNLFYPELYLLQGGYKHFYIESPDSCEPRAYVRMNENEEKCRKYFALRKKDATEFSNSAPRPGIKNRQAQPKKAAKSFLERLESFEAVV